MEHHLGWRWPNWAVSMFRMEVPHCSVPLASRQVPYPVERVVEKIVQQPYPVERIVEVPEERIVEQVIPVERERVVEKIVKVVVPCSRRCHLLRLPCIVRMHIAHCLL